MKAVRWYRLAADQGFADAQYNLGNMYANGQSVPQGYVEAHKWANLAASRDTGDDREKAATRSRSAADARDSLATRMTPAQVAEAQRRAREWQAAFDARQE